MLTSITCTLFFYRKQEVQPNCVLPAQVDVFSFSVVMYEVLMRQVTSAVVSQSGDANMPEMYASKVSHFAVSHCCMQAIHNFLMTIITDDQHNN